MKIKHQLFLTELLLLIWPTARLIRREQHLKALLAYESSSDNPAEELMKKLIKQLEVSPVQMKPPTWYADLKKVKELQEKGYETPEFIVEPKEGSYTVPQETADLMVTLHNDFKRELHRRETRLADEEES